MPTLYHDNDADLYARKMPVASVPRWALTSDPDGFPVLPVDDELTGEMTYNEDKRRFEAVIEGDAITSHLPPTDPDDPADRYAVVVWWGQNVRKVIPDIEVALRRV
jgi:hypothetical protein